MTKEESIREDNRLIGLVATVYPRVVALFLVYFALQYWIRVIGFHPGPENRFDTMSGHWRVAATSLSVMFPVAAVGLWGGYSWGIVVWLLAAGIEATMYVWFSGLFGSSVFTIGFHLVTVAGFLVIAVANRELR